jgi:hypothetical protein
MDALTEVTLPRSNGVPVFDAPWQARAHAMAVVSVERLDCTWDDFRGHLIEEIALDEQRPYWESWVAALEVFLATQDVATGVG